MNSLINIQDDILKKMSTICFDILSFIKIFTFFNINFIIMMIVTDDRLK